MKFVPDHDLHIHSVLSSCSNDPEQTTERILQYAEENALNTIVLADHFWDETVPGVPEWYRKKTFRHISQALPLPQRETTRFLFGCETELDRNLTLGISKKRFDDFDFIVIPTTHFHAKEITLLDGEDASPETRAGAWVRRFSAVLDMELPFHKIGIAHLTCGLMCPREWRDEMLRLLPQGEMKRLFAKAARLGVGIELNSSDLAFNDEKAELELRPFRIAKECGCKFYCGSDAHHPADFKEAKARFERAVALLGLSEDDKFIIQ